MVEAYKLLESLGVGDSGMGKGKEEEKRGSERERRADGGLRFQEHGSG